MKIKEIKSQNRRDFTAVYTCEHCGNEQTGYGYDDTNFHKNVIPLMRCNNCGKTSGECYEPNATNTRLNTAIGDIWLENYFKEEKAIRIDFNDGNHYRVEISHPCGHSEVTQSFLSAAHLIGRTNKHKPG